MHPPYSILLLWPSTTITTTTQTPLQHPAVLRLLQAMTLDQVKVTGITRYTMHLLNITTLLTHPRVHQILPKHKLPAN